MGKAYTSLNDDSLIPDPLDVNSMEVDALEQVSLQTLSPRALAESQARCPEVKCHKEGHTPKSATMGYHEIDGISLYCEISKNPRPMVPKELRDIILQTFHALGHPNARETGRRVSEFYYWPKLKAEAEAFVSSCHPCQSAK